MRKQFLLSLAIWSLVHISITQRRTGVSATPQEACDNYYDSNQLFLAEGVC